MIATGLEWRELSAAAAAAAVVVVVVVAILFGGAALAIIVSGALVALALWPALALARANRALREHNAELRAASESKSRFVANLSHELRNPINAVVGFSELMRDGRLGPLADRQREHLEIIGSSAQHVLTLIDDTFDLARIEAGHVRLEPEPVEPAAIAAACATSLRTLSAAKEIHVELDPRPLGTVIIDPVRLRQVILNYLSNAIKFSHRGGRVTVTLRHRDQRLLVEVSDTGPGVASDDQGRVFDEFIQLGRDRSGSGLGLAVTRMIVEAQGGEVGIRSSLGLGSTFYASIPAPQADAVEGQPWLQESGRSAAAVRSGLGSAHSRARAWRNHDLATR